MKLLVSALVPTGGDILIDGQPLAKESDFEIALSYLPQDLASSTS